MLLKLLEGNEAMLKSFFERLLIRKNLPEQFSPTQAEIETIEILSQTGKGSSRLSRRYKVLHNIGAGPKIEDVLFDWKIIGHFRYYGPEKK